MSYRGEDYGFEEMNSMSLGDRIVTVIALVIGLGIFIFIAVLMINLAMELWG